jgi:LuxR family transcriptional regulator, maltose regulon positive regulatory protein
VPRKPQQLAKLSRPRLYDALPRERLFRLLDDSRAHPATWIAAPPGSGKSTLLASYIEGRKLSCLWYQIDLADSDPATFFYYLGAAERDRPGRRSKTRPMPLLAPEYVSELPAFTRRYFREFFVRLGQPTLLVFDNFQELLPTSQVHDVLSLAMEEAPEGTSVVILSRLEPGQKYLRFVANGILARIDWLELKLTQDEAESILRTHLNLESSVVRALHEQSGGWAVGLRLLGEWIHRGGAIGDLGKPDSLQDVFGYFAGELFERASEADQRTLLQLSFLPRIPASAAELITGRAESVVLLENLYRAHLFVDHRGGVESVYQFHALLRAFLQHRATQLFDPAALNAAMISAAHVLEEFRHPEDAMPLYLRAGDVESAVALVLKEAKQLIAHGRWRIVVDWIASLPDQAVSRNCWLGYWIGSARIAIDPGAACEAFEQAFECARDVADQTCQVETSAAIIQTYVLRHTHFRPLDRWIELLEVKVNESGAFRDAEAELRVLGALLMALTYRQPGHPLLPQIIERVFELVQSDVDVNLRLVSAGYLCAHGAIGGPMQIARRALPILLKLLDREDIGAANVAWSWFVVSWVHCICRNEREGRDAVARVERIAEEEGLPYVHKFSAIMGAWIELYARNLDAAEVWLRRLEQIVNPSHLYDVAIFHGTRAFLYVLRGEADLSYSDARKAVEIFDEAGSTMHQLTYRINLALPLLQKGLYREVRAIIADMHRIGRVSSTHWWVSATHAIEAYTGFKEGSRETGLLALKRAFEYGRVHGDDYGFANCLQQFMPQLCVEALSAEIEVEYTRNLIRRHRWRPPVLELENWPWPIRIYTLGNFRIEVDGEALSFSRKAPKKVLALLKAVIAFGGKAVPEQHLMDALWRDVSGESAHEALSISLYRLRKLLVCPDAVQLSDGLISIDPARCWVDAWALERQLARDENEPLSGATAKDWIWKLYGGPFLPDDMDSSWALLMRERIHRLFLRFVLRAGRQTEEIGRLEEALSIYQKGIEANDLAEELYQGMIRCHQKLGRNAEALAVYQRMRHTLSVVLGTRPSADTEALIRSVTAR